MIPVRIEVFGIPYNFFKALKSNFAFPLELWEGSPSFPSQPPERVEANRFRSLGIGAIARSLADDDATHSETGKCGRYLRQVAGFQSALIQKHILKP
jgi:hypothetical protein